MMPYACVCHWVIVDRRTPGEEASKHVLGWLSSHGRLIGEDDPLLNRGEPYIGTSLAELDLEARRAVNARGKIIELVGEPWPADEALPLPLLLMTQRAERAWGLADGTTWVRVA